MDNFGGKTAFITGGAGGIGLSMARSLARHGANIMLADVDEDQLAAARADLEQMEANVATVACDVAKAEDVEMAAQRTLDCFGKVHIVINNAGVSLGGRTGAVSLEDWRWIVDINLMGVVHGVEIFTPLIRCQGEGGHFVNTASMAGHWAAKNLGPYNATKFAVVGYSETMRQELADDGIGVSVLCPGWVRTNIHKASLKRPSAADYESTSTDALTYSQAAAAVESGIDPDIVGDWVVDCIRAERFYIFTHPEMLPAIDARADMIKADYAACAADFRFKYA
ncbi:SDR family NAD(P)-dependent oxidoreductase [Hoeflea sp. TYP-13]|uniref:SDR family NAD(P)-dependent oxidoreductase n=1 Tax=Hoeflea sp. TYP-13 TaxID=3230023 RepID=UPI0034C5B8CF